MRSVINLDEVVVNENMPTISVGQPEIDVAAINGIQFWPALESWAASANNAGFKDKVANSEHNSAEHFTAASDVKLFSDGVPAYHVDTAGKEIISSAFTANDGFTLAVLCSEHIGFGSVNPSTGKWFVLSSSGKLRWQIPDTGDGFGNFDSYDGPLLSGTELNAVLFVVDRRSNQAFLRVNGVECMRSTVSADAVLLNELMIGAVNASSRTMRNGYIRAAVGFNRPLTEISISALELYLESLKP